MGFISKLFGKENNEVIKEDICSEPKQTSSSITDDMFNQFIELFKEKTIKETINIKLNTNKVKITDSKFGGIGYIPKDKEVPTNQNDEQYRLLAQIRLDDLPNNHIGLPETGLLQFWILDDDIMGLEGDYEVIYYPTIDETITSEDIEKKYRVNPDKESYFPMSDEFGLIFSLDTQPMSIDDYQFNTTFVDLWNNEYP
ncbi:MAG: YwqG family protein, partial [Coprobacillus sp.]